jgi:hypothetical protein
VSFWYSKNWPQKPIPRLWHVLIRKNHSETIRIFLYLWNAETLSFPMVLGSGGRRQSLLNEIFCCAKHDWSWFCEVFQAIENSAFFSITEMLKGFPPDFVRELKMAKTISSCDELWLVWCFLMMSYELLYLAIYCESIWYKIHTYVHRNSFNKTAISEGWIFTIAKTKVYQ